jgi:site-specific DNA recombinase
MRAAVYARVSTTRQAQAQGIEQQLDRLRAAVTDRGWELDDQHVYRDDGYSGARLGRPGLDRLRDHAALAELDVVLVTAPDRLARNYVHQVLLIDELAGRGCQVEFVDRPMSSDPHDQLLLQIRGAVAEYERTLIAERMRRGRQARLRAGTLLPWTTAPFGYRLDPDRPRRADAVWVDPGEAALVAQLFDWYLEPQGTVYRLARRLTELGVPTPRGGPRWNTASVRGILRNPSYAGRALSNRTQVAPARGRKSAMLPAGPGISHAPRPEEDWITVPVPAIVSEEAFAQVQAKLDANQQAAARNTRHEYLLRALISCGACRLTCGVRQTAPGYRYYQCRGRTDPLRVAQGQRCTARYIPAGQLDELVWADLCALVTDPAQVARALARARGGAWLPQELHARQTAIRQALGQLDRQQQRLLDAYLAEIIALAEFQRKRDELDRRRAALAAQQRQLDAAAAQRLELQAVADGIEAFCQAIRTGLATATFQQRRQLAELLIDRVIVTDGQVEIRYVLPTSPDGPHRPFCQLCKDHLDPPPGADHRDEVGQAGGGGGVAAVERQLAGVAVAADEQDAVPGVVTRRGIVRADLDHGPVVVAVALGAVAGPQPLPGPAGQPGRERAGGEAARGGGHAVARGDGDRVAVAQFAYPGAQVMAAIDLVGRHPAGWHACIAGPLEHHGGQLGLGRERQLVRDSGQLAALVVRCPVPRQVQGPVNQGLTRPACISQVHGYLAQADAAQRAGVLAGGPDGVRRRLLVARLVHHQYSLVTGELMRDPASRPVAHGVVVPHRTSQEMLQAVRAAVTEGLGQRLAVRLRHAHQHRLGHLPERLPRLAAREASRHQARHLPEAVPPFLLRYGCLHGRRVLSCCHRQS